MQAIILATDEPVAASQGVGGESKLHPLTEDTPGPLLPVLNRPIMAYALELLVRAGLRDIGVAVYRKAGCIEAHFGAGSRTGARLTYLLQREALGSAGSLRWAAAGLQDALVVLPGDALVDVDLPAALEFHRSHGGVATVIVHEPEPTYPPRPVAVATGGRVTDCGADATGERNFAETGAYIFEPRIFDALLCLQSQQHCERRGLDCYDDLLPELLRRAGGQPGVADAGGPQPTADAVHAFVAQGYWNPLHSVPAYHQAQLHALPPTPRVRYVGIEERELAPGIIVGRHVSVHPSARLVPPVYIGAGSQIESEVELGPHAVIGANTVVDEGATICNSTVLEGSYVGRLVRLDGRVVRGGLVVDTGSGESLRVVDPFLLGEVSPRPIVSMLGRAADCAGALLLLLLSLPALALTTAALLLTALFTGARGRVLQMRPHVRWERSAAGPQREFSAGGERVTYGVLHFAARPPLGPFLQRTQLDRLPALFSVLRGDLRLVGVKPLEPAEADGLGEEWQRLPYEGLAGFTGLWYVRSLRPQETLALQEPLAPQGTLAPQQADLDEMVAIDAYYTATRSFLEDVHLLLSTPGAWARAVAGPSSAALRPRTARPSGTAPRTQGASERSPRRAQWTRWSWRRRQQW